jgi:hypothetical protein
MFGRIVGALAISLALGACGPVATPGTPGVAGTQVVDGFGYRAQSVELPAQPRQVDVAVTVMNMLQRERQLEFPDGCIVLIRAYRDAARSGVPAWDQQRQAACTQAIQRVTFGAGEARFYRATVSVPDILGDTLAPGRYHFTALLRPAGRRVEVPAGDLELRR